MIRFHWTSKQLLIDYSWRKYILLRVPYFYFIWLFLQHSLGILPSQSCPTLYKKIICAILAENTQKYTLEGKSVVVSNMCGDLSFNRVQYHPTILALSVQCWLRSSFMAYGTTMNRGQHWLEQSKRAQYSICKWRY